MPDFIVIADSGFGGPQIITVGAGAGIAPVAHGVLTGLGADDHPQYVLHTEVDDVPVNGATTDPISSNWAFDHEAAADPHPQYLTQAEGDAFYDALGAAAAAVTAHEAAGDPHPQYVLHTEVHDVPVNGATTNPISSNWASDHETAGDPHSQYLTQAEGDAFYDALGAAAAAVSAHEAAGDPHPQYVLHTEVHDVPVNGATTNPISSNWAFDHEADAVDVHDASAISVVPFGSIAATDVQAALQEIVAEAVTDHGALTGLGDDDHPQYVLHTEVHDVPVNGATTDPISSNWAFDHEAAADPHPLYVLHTEVHDVPVDGATTNPISSNWAYDHAGGDPHTQYVLHTEVDDVPVNGATTDPISSNWAFDHEAAADPHPGYRLESADHNHQSTGLQGGQLDHGLALVGLADDDHTQYALLAGRSGGQTLVGGTAAGEHLTLDSTSNATKGLVKIGSDGVGSHVQIGGGTAVSEMRFMEASGNGTNYVGFKASTLLAASFIWTLPVEDGPANYVLNTDGAGNLGWLNVQGLIQIKDEGVNQGGAGAAINYDFVGAGVTASVTGNTATITIPGGVTDHGALTGLGDDDHPQYVLHTEVHDVPVNGATTDPISSNWAFDHEAAADPHPGYRLESADHNHQSTGLQAGQLDHGLALTGLGDDDHTQYALLAGRAGGQTLIGGTAASENLTLNSTSNATKGLVQLVTDGGHVTVGGGAAASELRFLEPSGGGTNYTGFIAPALAGNVIYTLPVADGSSGQQLTTDGAGVLSWAAATPEAVFTSSDLTISNAGTQTVAHGLGAVPDFTQSFLVNQTAEHGYSVGDIVCIGDYGGTVDRGTSMVVDATNIVIRYAANASVFNVLNKTTGVSAGITVANWRLRVRAVKQ